MDSAWIRRWSLLFALWWIQAAGVAFTLAPAGFLPIVMNQLGVGETGANWLISAIYLGMFTAAIPVGVVVEKFSVRRGITGGTLAFAAAATVSWIAGTDYWFVLGSRFVAGVLIVAVFTMSVPTIGAVFPDDREATAIGVYSTSVLTGMALGQFGGSVLATRVAWNASFLAFGLLALAGGGVFLVAARGLEFEIDSRDAPSRADIAAVFSQRSVWGVAVLAFVAFALNLLFNNWMPTYITNQFDVPLAVSGLLATTFPVLGVLGRVSSGPISERVFEGGRRPVVLGSFVLATPVIVLFPIVDTVAVLVASLFIAGFVTQAGLALLYTYVRELAPTKVEHTALAVLNAVGFFGAFVAPIATGSLVEATQSYQPLFVVGTALALVGCVVAWLTPDVARRA